MLDLTEVLSALLRVEVQIVGGVLKLADEKVFPTRERYRVLD